MWVCGYRGTVKLPNFEAQVRAGYRDVAGLVLSCDRNDIVEDVNNPGFVREWINRAPGLPSQPVIRNPGDPAPTYLGGRFSNPKQLVQSAQPTLAGPAPQRVQFDRARSTFLETEFIADDFPDVSRQFSMGYQFTKGADVSNLQAICGDSSDVLRALRRDGAGNAVISSNGLTSLVGDHPDGTFVYAGVGSAVTSWQRDGVVLVAGAGGLNQIVSGEKLYLGASDAGAGPINFLDGTLDTFNLWMGELSPRTIDFIWQTLNQDGTNYETDLRAPAANVLWTDITDDLSLNQYDRLRPVLGLPFRYIRFDLPASPALHRVQLAAAVAGIVYPDSALGGELFTWTIAYWESTSTMPAFTFDAGWTAVADLELRGEGHYTVVVARANGGSMVLHLDVQVAP